MFVADGQLPVVDALDVGVEELLLNDGLPDYVHLVGFCQDGLDVSMTTNVLKKFLMTMLFEIAIMKVAQVQFDVVVDQVVDTKNWGRDVADVEANIHVDASNDDVDVFVAMHLDVVTIGR